MINDKVFIDSSAFIALYNKDDEFYKRAIECLSVLKLSQADFITSNFIIDEVYTFLRSGYGKARALGFAQMLADNSQFIRISRISINEEKRAFKYFQSLDGRGVSFTDCTSFALMKRLGIKSAFTFDKDFVKAGFKKIP